MPTNSGAEFWKGKVRRLPIPPTRGPFINTPLLRLTSNKCDGERFWISTYNATTRSLGVLLDARGNHRLYRLPGSCFDSVCQEDTDTLWLCGNISEVIRLDLKTGAHRSYKTNAPSTLACQGMVLDRPSGKLLCIGFAAPRTVAFIFDYRRRKPLQVLDAPTAGKCMRFSFPNGDGTWSILLHMPGDHLLIWDPRLDSLESVEISPEIDVHSEVATSYMLIQDTQHRAYFPNRGWYDPRRHGLSPDGPRPETEMTWFGQHDGHAVGVNVVNGIATIGTWDLATGHVRTAGTLFDCPTQNITLTASGNVAAVSLVGDFFLLEPFTGALECARRIPADSVGTLHGFAWVDPLRILGAPILTERFWQLDLGTGLGTDCGRGAPGWGQINKIHPLRGKVYLAGYGGGELMEYDPDHPPRFPENPRVVADPPGGMRPVAITDDGCSVFYSCNSEYGKLGSVLTRYDTRTGQTRYASPLPEHLILSLFYDHQTRSLICGSSYRTEADMATPTSDICHFARIHPEDLTLIEHCAAPAGIDSAVIFGPLGGGRWVATGWGKAHGGWFVLDTKDWRMPAMETFRQEPPAWTITYAGKPGRFLVKRNGSLELWDLRTVRRLRVLRRPLEKNASGLIVNGNSVAFHTGRHVVVLKDCLRGA